jgi:hypothetical protein
MRFTLVLATALVTIYNVAGASPAVASASSAPPVVNNARNANANFANTAPSKDAAHSATTSQRNIQNANEEEWDAASADGVSANIANVKDNTAPVSTNGVASTAATNTANKTNTANLMVRLVYFGG